MNEKDREHFDELILKAVQAGKQETSGLMVEINKKFHMIDDKIDNYIKDDISWKKEAQPVIEMGKNIAGFSRITKILIAVIVAIGSLYGGILWLQNNVINK